MESSAETKQGRLGSRDNPELYENVPGHIIPIIEKEFEDFDSETKRFLDGDIDDNEFIRFRLKQGVYGQRQADVHMIRVKLPLGEVTPDQMDAFADFIEEFVPLRKGHISTRQNIQMHHIPLEHAAKGIRQLGEAGLTSREGCGNTVRNVTGDPWAGICENEAFDPTPYAGAFIRFFVRSDLTQVLPRKFKVVFTGTDEDIGITGIHDLGFIPRARSLNGKEEHGFTIWAGGGTAIMPRIAPLLYEFVPVAEYLKVSEAILRVFDRQEDLRANRARARMKFLVDRVGIDEFRNMIDQELEGDWTEGRDFSPDKYLFTFDEEAKARERAKPESTSTPNGDSREFDEFARSNVKRQRQKGFSAVEVRVPRGDLSQDQFRGLAQIMRDFTGDNARVSVQQNFILRWVRDESIYDVWRRLEELGLGGSGANEIVDIVSCPGTDSCKLGITSSMGLNEAVQERIEQMNIEDPLTRKIHVKMSGCPNGCSHHHIANIGLYGAAIKVSDKQVPAYIAHIGGSYDGGSVKFGKRLKARIPAKRVPEAVERFIRHYESNRANGEEFNDFVDRAGIDSFEELVKNVGIPEKYDQKTLDEFIDWSRQTEFKVERGEGECAV